LTARPKDKAVDCFSFQSGFDQNDESKALSQPRSRDTV
jgi:hypothetical protein